MRLIPQRLTAWRRRGRVGALNDLAFLSPEERKQLAGLEKKHGTLSRDSSRLGAGETLGPRASRRSR